jgi:hypothetical protein
MKILKDWKRVIIAKIGFHRSFPHATGIPSSPYVLDNTVSPFCAYFYIARKYDFYVFDLCILQ